MKNAWERFYEKHGRPWGGAVELPAIPPKSSVLELGCGGGRFLLPLLRGKQAAELAGVDIARSPLVQLANDAPGILVQADAAHLPFRDKIFDVVCCRHVLGHLMEDDRKAAAREILRVLKKTGKAHFEAFSTKDARFGKGREIEPRTFLRGDGIIHHYFEDEEARRLFGDASVVTITKRGWSERAGLAKMARQSLVAEILR